MQQEPNRDNGPKGVLAGLIVAHAVCCGGILLAATGGLAGASAWFLEGGAVWLASALAAIAAGWLEKIIHLKTVRFCMIVSSLKITWEMLAQTVSHV